MREIKFRALDKANRKIYDVVTLDTESVYGKCEEPVLRVKTGRMLDVYQPEYKNVFDHILMQYTGFKDKNGVEIYEGDIITTDLERNYLIVEYRNGAFMLNCNDGLEDYYDIFFGTSEEPKKVYKYGEVIGNIYDNPELMEE